MSHLTNFKDEKACLKKNKKNNTLFLFSLCIDKTDVKAPSAAFSNRSELAECICTAVVVSLFQIIMSKGRCALYPAEELNMPMHALQS